jgi:MOSC domain-containing protein YiiM
MLAHQRIATRKGLGLEGDRYFDIGTADGADRAITLIEMEHIDAFNAAYGTALPPHAPRRNVVTSGIRLNELCGRQFRIGGVLIEAWELCEPCRLFKVRTDPRTLKFFDGKGGLRARVLSDGVIEVGDEIQVV